MVYQCEILTDSLENSLLSHFSAVCAESCLPRPQVWMVLCTDWRKHPQHAVRLHAMAPARRAYHAESDLLYPV